MGKEQLTTARALKFARHDFLNELQLILLHIDLGKIPEAKQVILDATEALRQVTILERLGLPSVELWLETFPWNYTTFKMTMTCSICSGKRTVDDNELSQYLLEVFCNAEKVADPTSEYEVSISVNATESDWSITFVMHGKMDNLSPAIEPTGNFFVEEMISQNEWKFTVRGQ